MAVVGRFAPRVNVDRRGDGRAVVRDVGFQRAVEEEVVFLALPDARPVVMAQLGQLVDIYPALEVKLVPEGLQAAERRGL